MKKVMVALSGGVDSSVAAALLKKQGYNVIGAFMKFWSERQNYTENKCCSEEAEKTARQVAAKLDIPFYTIDFRKEFKKEVVDYFLEEYKVGRTPNPCVVCNKKIKFDLLLQKAFALGADYLATGHYIKLKTQKSKIKSTTQNPKLFYKLYRAKDKDKDQSYFLYNLTQEHLRYLLFPIGNYNKTEIRQLAKKFDLPFSQKESFDVCFISGNDHNEFLKKNLKLKPGHIIADGKKIGEHQGLPLYTLGQRRDIGIDGTGPYYVVETDYENNNLIVTSKINDPRLFSRSLIAQNTNWISGQEPKLPLKIKAKIRYRAPFVAAEITKKLKDKDYKILFNEPQRAITSGQSVVFYLGNELIGGGVIK